MCATGVRGTPDEVGNCYPQEIVMFHGTYDRAGGADRYLKAAGEYAALSKAANDP
jgi:hypothetical protein